MKFSLYSLVITLLLSSTSLFAQEDKYGSTPEQQVECKEALSIYRSDRDQKLPEVYQSWQKACEVCPSKVSERLYSDGVKFIKVQLKGNKDAARKEVLLDSLFLTYQQRADNFPSTKKKPNNGCEVMGMKASDMLKYRQETELDNVYNTLKESVECTGKNTSAAVISSYYISMYEKLKLAEDEAVKEQLKGELLTEYLKLQDIIDYKVAGYNTKIEEAKTAGEEKKTVKYEKYKGYYTTTKDNLDEIFLVVATCDEMVPILQKKLEAEPENLELAQKALRLMNKKECTENDIFLPTAVRVHEANPTHESAYSLAIGYAKKRELKKALEFAEEAVSLCTDCSEKENYLLKAGQIASATSASGKAIRYANQVLELNPNSGEAYLLKGDAILSTAKSCDDGGIAMRAVYIQAGDYYLKAKSADSSVASKANSKYSAAKSQFPSKEELFIPGLKPGQTFTIPCSGASVTLKTRD